MNQYRFLFLWMSLGLYSQMYGMPSNSACDFFTQDTLFIQVADCNAFDSLCLDVPLEDIMMNYEITVNGAIYEGSLAGCDIDTTYIFHYSNITGSGNLGPYLLEQWIVNGVVYSGEFQDMPSLVDSMNLWNPEGNWVLNPTAQTIVGGSPGYSFSVMDIYHEVLNLSSQMFFDINVNPNGSGIFFQPGIHQFIISEIVGDCADTLEVFMACITPEVNQIIAEIGQIDTACIDFSEFLFSAERNFVDFCPEAWGESADFQLINGDSCIQITSLQMGVDSFCLAVCDGYGFCDTTNFVLVVPNEGNFYEVFDTIAVGHSESYCFNTSNFLGPIQGISQGCQQGSAPDYSAQNIDFYNDCLNYQGELSGGQDTTCWIVCDVYGICDTTLLYVFVTDPIQTQIQWVDTTVFLNTSGTFCPDQSELIATPESIVDRCALNNDGFVFFNTDPTSFCVNYSGMEIGCDTACIFLTDAQSTIDTTYLVICTQLPQTEHIIDTLMLGDNNTYCLSQDQLGGAVSSVQFCEDFSGNTVNIDINNVDLCITANSLSEGNDTICLVICDDFSICDTTILQLTVIPSNVSGPPVATDDSYITSQNDNLVIHYCENDLIPGNELTNGYPLLLDMGGAGPVNGQVSFIDDCTLEYIPGMNCPFSDSITYIICNPTGCDTAIVRINVECEDNGFHIYQGFSPNGDNINDVFQISGIDQFPDHKLFVYNRWGNLVFEAMDYQNDWTGTLNSTELPDGTYFYLFDDGEGDVHAGYIVLFR